MRGCSEMVSLWSRGRALSRNSAKTPQSEIPRIVLVVYSLGRGGAERVSVGMATAWALAGWNVTVITLAPVEIDFFEVPPSVRHIRLALPTTSRGVFASLVNNARRIAALRSALKVIKPHAAVGMMSASAILLAFAGLGLPGRRFGAERTYPPMLPLRPGKGLLRTFGYGLLDGVTSQTSEAARWILDNTRARNVPVIPNPISLPLPRYEPALVPENFLSTAEYCLLAVGRLSEEKQFDRLIDTFAKLAVETPDWTLVILGDGPDRTELEAKVNALGLSARILLPGACGNLEDWYRRADLQVLTSRFEGFPNVLLEGLAHGVPAVALNCLTGPSDIIEDGVNGILVPAGDFKALETTLRTTMNDTDLRARLAAAAGAVNERFAVSRIMAMWNEALGLTAKRGGN